CSIERPQVEWRAPARAIAGVGEAPKKPAEKLPVIFVIDQFEQALQPTHDPKDLDRFIRDLFYFLKANQPIVKFAIAVRADWLHHLFTEVRQLQLDLKQLYFFFQVDYLTRDSARTIIVKPLQRVNIPYEDRVIDDILDNLVGHDTETSVEKAFIQPIQLQLVVDSLYSAAAQTGDPSRAFTWQNYDTSGGVIKILNGYLEDNLAGREDAWRLLDRFVAKDGKTSQSLRYSSLVNVPARSSVESDIQDLVYRGLLQVYERERGDKYCRLAHDYIAQVVTRHFQENTDKHTWKQAEDWLAQATEDWKNSSTSNSRDKPILELNRYARIYADRDYLTLSDDNRQLLIASALRNG
ncbi:MAG: hypothetical protein MN733_22305, partial [Nitrososphaera sp.]|nr:hypothetical protein [Nitrososphaera sp.]